MPLIGLAVVFGACQSDPVGVVGSDSDEPRVSHAGTDAISGAQTAFDVGTATATVKVIWHSVNGATAYRLVIYTTSSASSVCSVDSPEYGDVGVTLDFPAVSGTPWTTAGHLYYDQAALPSGIYCALVMPNPAGSAFETSHFTLTPPPEASQVAFDLDTNTGTARTVWHAVTEAVTYTVQIGPVGLYRGVWIPACFVPVYDPELGFHVIVIVADYPAVVGTPTGTDQLYLDHSDLAPGTYCSRVKSDIDGAGFLESPSFTILAPAINHPPTADWTFAPTSPAEGQSITFDATAFDEDGDSLEYSWDLGDDTGSTQEDPIHAYSDDGSYQVGLTVSDGIAWVVIEKPIIVANLAPQVSAIAISNAVAATGVPITMSTSFSDAGSVDTHLAIIDWGDGTTTNVGTDIILDPATSPLSAGHAYLSPGIYTITVTVQDDDGDSGSSTSQYVHVYDPSAGFVTGGGWIAYDSQACPTMCSGVGVGEFRFASRYGRRATVPSGTTRFEFYAASLGFTSSDYDWLVVSGSGKRAQFEGNGRINGIGSYGFLVVAIDGATDGTPDGFRIKIWNTSNGMTVFDNQWGAEIDGDASTVLDGVQGGGSIVIHRLR